MHKTTTSSRLLVMGSFMSGPIRVLRAHLQAKVQGGTRERCDDAAKIGGRKRNLGTRDMMG